MGCRSVSGLRRGLAAFISFGLAWNMFSGFCYQAMTKVHSAQTTASNVHIPSFRPLAWSGFVWRVSSVSFGADVGTEVGVCVVTVVRVELQQQQLF